MNSLPVSSIPDAPVLPFAVFLSVANSDDRIGVADVECFRKLIRQREWCKSDVVRDALEVISRDYTKLWQTYASGNFQIDPSILNAELHRWRNYVPEDEIGFVHDDLLTIAQSVWNSRPASRRKSSKAVEGLATLLHNGNLSKGTSTTGLQNVQPISVGNEQAHNLLVWNGGRIRLRCAKVVQETVDVKSFSFTTETPSIFSYKPGQFVTLELEINGQIVRRSYTVSSSPSRPYNLTITVKRLESGLASNWLHEHLVPGQEIWMDGPYGKFNCCDHPSDKYLFFAAGSGVTPIISMARWLVDTDPDSDITIIYTAKTQTDFILRDELLMLSRVHPKLKLILFCTRP
jgi:glycine betaine catabolism B